MTDLQKVDGDYVLTFKLKNDTLKWQQFGYFTNGYPSGEITKIEVKEDTLRIDQIYEQDQ